ncbi:hypothetical protein LA080_013209 [Diaporthe eres]|nr:hypothetical protein LA080_013209 [Diaporthe eres]
MTSTDGRHPQEERDTWQWRRSSYPASNAEQPYQPQSARGSSQSIPAITDIIKPETREEDTREEDISAVLQDPES